MKKLVEVKAGDKARIAKIEGDTRFMIRITSIGLTIGCPVTVLQNEKKQPLLVHGRDTMIALNRKECEKILVEALI